MYQWVPLSGMADAEAAVDDGTSGCVTGTDAGACSRERTSFERVAMENLVDLGLFLAGLGVFFLGVAALWWVGDWSGKQ